MNQTKEKYLQVIFDQFMKFGIKSVTMADISKNLSISKKTLYKYFKDKDDIVDTLMMLDIEEEKELMENTCCLAGNAIEETYAFSAIIAEKLKGLNTSVMYDLEKYHKKTWAKFIEHKRGYVNECIKNNLERGLNEGLYRKNLNPEVVSKLYSEKIDLLFDMDLFPSDKFSFEEVYAEMMRYHLKGIVSKEGLKYLKEKE
ncbi:MAG: TetR/AcrR family transcriptional regulator [Flavobacteriales bacterium]